MEMVIKMANINIGIDDKLHKELRHKAVEEETTIKDLIIKAIKKAVK